MEKQELKRHSMAHVVAAAAFKLYPNAKFGVGPTVENGFYYDIDFGETITETDLKKIEKQAKKMVSQGLNFEREEMDIDEAIKYFKNLNQDYKVELLNDLKEKGTTKIGEEESVAVEKVSIYKTGDFVDLCRGPHVKNTKELNAKGLKLNKLAGAYWRGDAENAQLQRVYGLYFDNGEELQKYLELLVEAEKRDHKKLGKELGLFSFHDVGQGFPFFKPNGTIILNELMSYWREAHDRAGYGEVRTPVILSRKLWEQSGHWENYKENMYTTVIDGEDYAIKPMNCPGGMLLFKEDLHSYRDLPLRWAEVGLDHRHELSGVLNGLLRVRAFWQDDAHIFMRPDQIKQEILGVLKLADEMYSTFGLDYHLELSTRPQKSIGTDEAWELSTRGLQDALEDYGRGYQLNEGDGAFYGPKIDVHVKDALGRTWQCATIQLDMNLPERFDLNYIDEKGEKVRPVMIHRVIFGSVERFFGILVEHYAGAFPTWLAPKQVALLPVSEKHVEGMKKIKQELFDMGIRVYTDEADETVGKKVKKAVSQKIPYIIVVGDKELEGGEWTVRVRGQEEQLQMSKKDFVEKVLGEIKTRK